jgi:hypothetical protein
LSPERGVFLINQGVNAKKRGITLVKPTAG